jgi:hypothetical protein
MKSLNKKPFVSPPALKLVFSLLVIGFASAHASPLIVKPYDPLDSISQSLFKEPAVPLITDVASTAKSTVVPQAAGAGWPGVGAYIEFDFASGKWAWVSDKWPNRETTFSAHVKLRVDQIVNKDTVKGNITIGGKLKSKKGNNPIDERTFTDTSYSDYKFTCIDCSLGWYMEQRNYNKVSYYFSGTYYIGWEVSISGGGASSWTWPYHPNWFGAMGSIDVKGFAGIETMKLNAFLNRVAETRMSYNGGITWGSWQGIPVITAPASYNVPNVASFFQFNGSANGSGTIRKSTNSAGKDVYSYYLNVSASPSIEIEGQPFGIKVKAVFPVINFYFKENWDITKP